MTGPVERYSKSLIVIHWLTAVFVVGAWLTAEGGRKLVENPPLLHFAFGLTVLALVLPRLMLRFAGPTPRPASGGGWLGRVSGIGHGVLYLLLIAVPLSGWYVASRMGVEVGFPGLHLPALTAPVPGKPGLIGELHENGGNLILILAGLHMAMALWHQFVRRDGTLRRMSLR